MQKISKIIGGILAVLCLGGLLFLTGSRQSASALEEIPVKSYFPQILHSPQYVLVSWNDLGMHCYNQDFQDLAVLPPANTLYAQVIERGNPPKIVTQNIRVEYTFPLNLTSVGKTNFWNYAQDLFNLPEPLPVDVGLAGNGMSGTMKVVDDHFVAEWIPLTEFIDGNTTQAFPYQVAEVSAYNTLTNTKVATLSVVAPVSTEMHCDNCHFDGGVEGISTGRVETNILTLHDQENSEEYPQGSEYGNSLMNNRPVLCADCHSSNALGKPGAIGIPSLSNAMHEKHAGEVPDTQAGCYNCHPGPETQCQRDVMFVNAATDCIDCHGTLTQVAQNPQPWLNEPRCDTCHDQPEYAQDADLYRFSRGHGDLFCSACHDSPHAIAESREPSDALKFIQLQGEAGTLSACVTCHTQVPQGPGPHGNSLP